jgi:hypothetical protein
MLFSWYAGWNISFFKGYEQAAVGPLWGFAGIFLFMAAMTYVPIAQARQAVTGRAKAFWNYRRVRDVIHRRPLACLLLTAGYTALGFVFMIAINSLQFIGNADRFAELSNPEIIAFLNRYYFWWAALFIGPAFLAVLDAAAREVDRARVRVGAVHAVEAAHQRAHEHARPDVVPEQLRRALAQAGQVHGALAQRLARDRAVVHALAADLRVAVDQQHAPAPLRGVLRRLRAGRASAQHDHVEALEHAGPRGHSKAWDTSCTRSRTLKSASSSSA